MRRFLPTLATALALGCASLPPGPPAERPVPPPLGLGEAQARQVLARFVDAGEAGRWDEACALLSARWRAVYTPGRLAQDQAGAGPVAREAAARVKAALAAGAPVLDGPARARLAGRRPGAGGGGGGGGAGLAGRRAGVRRERR
ncbi:MAG: hypothetical protein QM767_12845 [Anaeromyxobacter sp.]